MARAADTAWPSPCRSRTVPLRLVSVPPRSGLGRACIGVCTARGFGELGERGLGDGGGGSNERGGWGERLRALGRRPSGLAGLLRPEACWEL